MVDPPKIASGDNDGDRMPVKDAPISGFPVKTISISGPSDQGRPRTTFFGNSDMAGKKGVNGGRGRGDEAKKNFWDGKFGGIRRRKPTKLVRLRLV